MYNGKLYKCTTATTGGTWNANNWAEAILSDDVTIQNNAISDVVEKVESVNIFDGTLKSGIINSNGQEVDNVSWMRSGFIPIKNGESKLYFLRNSSPYQFRVCFYTATSTDTFISSTNAFNSSTTYLKSNVSIPPTAKYFRFTINITSTVSICISYTEQNVYVPYVNEYCLKDGVVTEEALDTNVKAKMYGSLFGKTIVVLGDSIVGNFYDSTGICSQIAEKTGATVINCAFGGTRMAYEYSQYGDATPGASGYVDGATDAQKNQVDQYRYWNALSGYGLAQAIATDIWTLQDVAVANMSSGLDYFSSRLTTLKAVDFNEVDYLIWEYGTNDFATRVMLSDTEDTTNLFAYDNAYRGAIEAISTAYPNIQIIPITPIWRFWQESGTFLYDSNTHTTDDYEGTARLLTAFVEKVKAIAMEYQLPYVDDYYTLGANKFTRSAFFDATDGAHPNANGRARIAEHIASQLDSVI